MTVEVDLVGTAGMRLSLSALVSLGWVVFVESVVG